MAGAHGWMDPRDARRAAAEFGARTWGGEGIVPPAVTRLLRSLPIRERRLTPREAAELPAALAAAFGEGELTLRSWRGPTWATTVFGRMPGCGAAGPDARAYHFHAVRVDTDRRRLRIRSHAVPFVLSEHALGRFSERAGRDPAEMFAHGLLEAVRYGTAAAVALSARPQAGYGGLRLIAPLGEGALVSRDSVMAGDPSPARPGMAPLPEGVLPGIECVFGRLHTETFANNPLASGCAAVPRGSMVAFEAPTFLNRTRMGLEQRVACARVASFMRDWREELTEHLDEIYLQPETGSPGQAEALHPAMYSQLGALLEETCVDLEEAARAALARRAARAASFPEAGATDMIVGSEEQEG